MFSVAKKLTLQQWESKMTPTAEMLNGFVRVGNCLGVPPERCREVIVFLANLTFFSSLLGEIDAMVPKWSWPVLGFERAPSPELSTVMLHWGGLVWGPQILTSRTGTPARNPKTKTPPITKLGLLSHSSS